MASPDIARLALAVAVAVTVMMIGLSVTDQAIGQSTGVQSVTNETITAETGEWVRLDGYALDASTVEVYGFNDTSDSYELAEEGTDYDIRTGPGELKALEGSSLIDDGETVKVTYEYEAADAITTFIVGFIPVLLGVLTFLVVAEPITQMT